MVAIGVKRCQNMFQMIPDTSFFDIANRKFFGFVGLRPRPGPAPAQGPGSAPGRGRGPGPER